MSQLPAAFIYLRVSTPSQVDKAINPEGYSLPVQRQTSTHHIEYRHGEREIHEYVEPGKPATTMNRPKLQEMLADLEIYKPDVVVFHDVSRLARNELDAFTILDRIERAGAKLESATESFDTAEPEGRLMFALLASTGAYRSRGDAKKVKLGLERKFLDGGASGPDRLPQHQTTARWP